MSARKAGTKVYSLVMFLVVSVLSGLLLAGLSVPVVALAAGTTKAAAQGLEDLPADLETPPQPEGSKVLLADGSVLAQFYDQNRQYVPLDQISVHMQKAQLAIEDHRFYEHGAIDLIGTVRAALGNFIGRDTQGGSTLTQQYVKLVRLQIAQEAGDKAAEKAATEATISRKIIEMRYAVAMEKKLTKDQILERYLNLAYYGSGAYGVEAAARHYFGISAAELNVPQSAMLAGLVQNPSATDPVRNPVVAMERRNTVINRIWQLDSEQPGWFSKIPPYTQADIDWAKAQGFDANAVVSTPGGCQSSRYPFICDYVERTLLSDQMSVLGETREERQNVLRRGGLTIQTIIDPAAQDSAQSTVSAMLDPRDPVLGITVMLEPKTGLITAMAQSRPTMGDDKAAGQTYYNYVVRNDMGGAEGFQAGSTFKAFTLANALSLGVPLSHRYLAPDRMAFKGQKFISCDGPFTFNQEYTPKNAVLTGNPNRAITLMDATRQSVNTYYVQLERDTGICGAVKMAQSLGVEASMAVPGGGNDLIADYHMDYNPSFTLGVADVTPMSMAIAYATFANRGVRCDPIVLKSVVSRDGSNIAVPDANCRQVIDPEVADGVNYVLKAVMDSGTGAPARVPGGWPQAGKTGTTDSAEARWMAGYTPELVAVSLLAVDKANDYWNGRRRTVEIRSPYTGRAITGQGAYQLWRGAMTAALQTRPKTDFDPYTAPTEVKVKLPQLPAPRPTAPATTATPTAAPTAPTDQGNGQGDNPGNGPT